MLKKSSQELLHQIGQYLAWSFPGVTNGPPRGLNSDIVIHTEVLKTSSQEPLGQFQPNSTGNNAWEFQLCSNKGGGPFWGPINA